MHDGGIGRGALEEAAPTDLEIRARLGFLYRLARALTISRAPDLERLFGRRPSLPPSTLEPNDLPDPTDLLGSRTVREASARSRDAHEPDVAGGVEDLFDQWLRLVYIERRRARA